MHRVMIVDNFSKFVEVVRLRAEKSPDRRAYTFLMNGEIEESYLTYGELDGRAKACGALLQQINAVGERALLLYSSSLEFIVAFCGCLYSGAIAIPVPLPSAAQRKRTLQRLQSIIEDSQATLLLTTSDSVPLIEELLLGTENSVALQIIPTDKIQNAEAANWQNPPLTPDSLAYLQYTSGSTSAPKGVRISHHNLLSNCCDNTKAWCYNSDSISVTWMPYYHDYGLVDGLLQPLYCGIPSIVMSPFAFLKNPMRWLRAISHYKATHSASPNFGYDHCINRVKSCQLSSLDLSSWRVASSGAELVRSDTLKKFAQIFSACGFRSSIFFPSYGLAEATLLVCAKDGDREPTLCTVERAALEKHRVVEAKQRSAQTRTIVGCGRPNESLRLEIVNPTTLTRCLPEEVGEIWVSGASVAQGYWGRKKETAAVFQTRLADSEDGQYLRTGDLGFVHNGELFVTGRIKDVILFHGNNYYAEDVEFTVEKSHQFLNSGGCAAFAIETGVAELLVVAAEVERQYQNQNLESVIWAVREAVAEEHGLQVYAVALLKSGSVPKTSSGKIQRSACREAFVNNDLDVLELSIDKNYADEIKSELETEKMKTQQVISQKRADEIVDWLRYYARERINSQLMDLRRSISPHIVLDFGNRGVLGLQVEERYGGSALCYRDLVRVLEQLGAIDLNLGIFVVMNNALGIRPIQRSAPTELREDLLPILAQGRELASFAVTEPGAGSNPRAIASTAIPHSPNSWQLRGTKIWSGSSTWSGVINIFVKHLDSNHQPMGISGFAVRQGTPGLRMGPEALTMGLRGMVQNTIYLEDVKVNRQQILGEAGGGMAVAQDAMMFTRLCLAAVSLGAMKRCVRLMLRYAERRHVSTGRLLDNPLTRLRISEHTAAIAAVEALVNVTAELLDRDGTVPEELYTACKIIAPELLWRSVDDLVQMLGGRGYLENNLAAQIFRDARAIRIFEGPTETLNMHLGSRATERTAGLRVLLRDKLEASDLADRFGEVALAITARHTNNSPFSDERAACNQRIYLLVGEIAAKTILLAVIKRACKRQPTTRLQHAVDWCEQLLQETVASSLETTPAERSLLNIGQLQNLSQDLAAEIGDIEQTMAGEESELDTLLRQEPDELPSRGSSDRYLEFGLVDNSLLPEQTSPPAPILVGEGSMTQQLSASVGGLGGLSLSSPPSAIEIENWLVQWVTRQLKIDANALDRTKSFPALGVESVTASNLAMDLEEWLGLRVDINLLWDYPDIPSLAVYLATKINDSQPSFNATSRNGNGHKKVEQQEFPQIIIPNQIPPKSQIHPSNGFLEAEKIPQFFKAVTEQRDRKLLIEGRWVYDFASCNYLGLDLHPKVKEAILPAVEKWGTHPSWTRFVAWPAIYDELEEELAKLVGVSDLMVFPSLTLLQMGVIPMLAGNDGIIFSDIYAHRCIYEACRVAQHNGSELIQYRHEDLNDLEEKLAKSPMEKTKIIAIDGVYSLAADLANIPGYVRLAKKYNALIYVDDAHSFGILGENPSKDMPYGYKGNGIVNHFGLRFAEDNIIYVAGLSKAFSSYAAFITCGDRDFKNKLRHVWTSGYSGPSPVASLATALAGLEVNRQEGEQLREKLYHLTRKLVTQARAIGFEVENDNYVPLFSVIIGDIQHVVDVCQLLWEYNILITPAVFPAVPLNKSALRFSITAANTEEEVNRAIEALEAVWHLLQKRKAISR